MREQRKGMSWIRLALHDTGRSFYRLKFLTSLYHLHVSILLPQSLWEVEWKSTFHDDCEETNSLFHSLTVPWSWKVTDRWAWNDRDVNNCPRCFKKVSIITSSPVDYLTRLRRELWKGLFYIRMISDQNSTNVPTQFNYHHLHFIVFPQWLLNDGVAWPSHGQAWPSCCSHECYTQLQALLLVFLRRSRYSHSRYCVDIYFNGILQNIICLVLFIFSFQYSVFNLYCVFFYGSVSHGKRNLPILPIPTRFQLRLQLRFPIFTSF